MSHQQVHATPPLDEKKDEVGSYEHQEVMEDGGTPRHYHDIDEGFDPIAVKRTMRKVDWRLIPILAAMYTVSAPAIGARPLTDRSRPWTVQTCLSLALPTTRK